MKLSVRARRLSKRYILSVFSCVARVLHALLSRYYVWHVVAELFLPEVSQLYLIVCLKGNITNLQQLGAWLIGPKS